MNEIEDEKVGINFQFPSSEEYGFIQYELQKNLQFGESNPRLLADVKIKNEIDDWKQFSIE